MNSQNDKSRHKARTLNTKYKTLSKSKSKISAVKKIVPTFRLNAVDLDSQKCSFNTIQRDDKSKLVL